MTLPRFEKFKSKKNDEFYFRLRSFGNGEIILASEGYTTEASCDNGISSVKTNAPNDDRYDRKQNGSNYSFNLKASNGQVIGRGEVYTTEVAREKGIAAVKRDAPNASVIEI